MIHIRISENDFIYLLIAIVVIAFGAGIFGMLLFWYVSTHLDEIPEGEEPYFEWKSKEK